MICEGWNSVSKMSSRKRRVPHEDEVEEDQLEDEQPEVEDHTSFESSDEDYEESQRVKVRFLAAWGLIFISVALFGWPWTKSFTCDVLLTRKTFKSKRFHQREAIKSNKITTRNSILSQIVEKALIQALFTLDIIEKTLCLTHVQVTLLVWYHPKSGNSYDWFS